MLQKTALRSFLFRPTPINNMKVFVGVKRVVDYAVKIRVKDNKVVTDNVKMSVNPFDEIAVEEAVRLKEKNIATEVTAVTVGPKKAEEVLRTAMALGCDNAIHVVIPDTAPVEGLESLAVAKIFAKLHAEKKPDLWILGKQAVDGDCGTTSQLLAGLLDLPQGTFVSTLENQGDKIKVTRETDTGVQEVLLKKPCVVAADLRLNTPRFASLPNIMKARKKPVDARDVSTFGVDIAPRLTTQSAKEPETRKAGQKVKTVEELVDKLKNEAKVL